MVVTAHSARKRTASETAWPALLVALFLFLGAWLRLDQFTVQVLLDDEWHAVHQLLGGASPRDLFLSFGSSDYSIPLGLLYFFEARWFGLNELLMRWPMLLAGLATLALVTAWAWRRLGPGAAAGAAFLLALSPLLVIYSRTARPYAITLLLACMALYAFYRFLEARRIRPAWGAGYAIAAALSVWLHPVTGPFVVAPFLVEGLRAAGRGRIDLLGRLFVLGLIAGGLMAALVLPPLLNDPAALAGKSGAARFSLETFTGVWFAWLGTPSALLVAGGLVLALLGLPRLWRSDPLWSSVVAGLALTAASIVFLEPRWAQHPQTLARYLLPALPLLILAVVAGAVTLLEGAGKRSPGAKIVAGVALLTLTGTYAWLSPVRDLVARPNAQGNHSVFQVDFRPGSNPIAAYQEEHIPRSVFWERLASTPGETGVVAVAPFHFETYNWAAPRWERSGGRRVLPFMLHGWCTEWRRGEAPRNEWFRLDNAVYPVDLDREPPADWLVLTKPFTGYVDGREGQAVGGAVFEACRPALEGRLGAPDYEDASLLAWRLLNRG